MKLYTYHIALTGTAYTEFIPSKEVKVTHIPHGNDIFLLPSVDEIKIGALKNPALYNSLQALYFDSSTFGQQLKIVIRRKGVDKYFFRTSVSNTTIDTQNKIFTLQPEPDDEYQTVIDAVERKFYETEMALNVFTNDYFYYWSNPTNAFVNSIPSPFTSFNDASKVVTWQYTGSGTNIARMAWTGCANSGDQVKVLVSAASGGGSLRLVDSGFNAVSNTSALTAGLKTLTATGTAAYLEFYVTSGTSGGFTYEAYKHRLNNEFAGDLRDVIDYMLGTMLSTGLSCRSTVLFNDVLPSVVPTYIATYLSSYPGTDYVTEAKGPKVFNDNFMIGFADTFGTDLINNEFSLRDILEIIRIKFRCYWYIDSDGYFRIEHLKYFRKFASQLDLTQVAFSPYKVEIDKKGYRYDKGNIYSQVTYSESNAENEDFVDIHVNSDVIKTSNKTTSISPPEVSTDIAVGLLDSWSPSGFVLVITDIINSTRVVRLRPGVITPAKYYQNVELSLSYLASKYWAWDCDADSATVSNGQTITAEGVKEFLIQEGIRFYNNGDINWYAPVTVSLGNGWLKKIEHFLESDFFVIDLAFNPYSL